MGVTVHVDAEFFEGEEQADVEARVIREAGEILAEKCLVNVQERVWEAMKEKALAEADRAIAAVLTEGWQKTSTWGENAGPRLTLKDLVRQTLDNKQGDTYGNYKRTLLERMLREAVKGALRGDFQKEVDAACKQIREQIKEHFAGDVRKAVLSTLGIRE